MITLRRWAHHPGLPVTITGYGSPKRGHVTKHGQSESFPRIVKQRPREWVPFPLRLLGCDLGLPLSPGESISGWGHEEAKESLVPRLEVLVGVSLVWTFLALSLICWANLSWVSVPCVRQRQDSGQARTLACCHVLPQHALGCLRDSIRGH